MPQYKVSNGKESVCMSKIYNSSTGTVLGRTPLDWGRLLIYYLAFYSVLAAMFFGQLTVVMKYIITNDLPYRSGDNSILSMNPGISTWPKQSEAASSIMVSTNQSSNFYKDYVKSRSEALDEYIRKPIKSVTECDLTTNTKSVDDVNQPCRFDPVLLGDCSDPKSAIDNGHACMYWKINRIYGYIPDIENRTFADSILLDCQGQNPVDITNLGEPVYHPSITAGDGKTYGRFSHAFFPFLNQPDFHNQLVAVSFPNMTKNIASMVECNILNLKKKGTPVTTELFVSTN